MADQTTSRYGDDLDLLFNVTDLMKSCLVIYPLEDQLRAMCDLDAVVSESKAARAKEVRARLSLQDVVAFEHNGTRVNGPVVGIGRTMAKVRVTSHPAWGTWTVPFWDLEV